MAKIQFKCLVQKEIHKTPAIGSERLGKKETQSAKKNKIVVRYLPLLPQYSAKSTQRWLVLSFYISVVIIWSDFSIF